MQKRKHNRKFRRKVVSLLTLALMLAPMAALAVYARSAAYDFDLTFNHVGDTDYDRAYKTDVGGSSGHYAQANVSSAYFGGNGSATMWVANTSGTRITGSASATEGTKYFYYATGALAGNAYVDLTATLTSGSGGGCSGVWWP